jgi:MazG family protein
MTALPGVSTLLQVMKQLRDPKQGCPWDRAQTLNSLVPYFIEELYEYLEALQIHGPQAPQTWEELGDVLFQIVFHCQILEEQQLISLDQIAQNLADKLQKRHPHVFDSNGPRFDNPESVNRAWEGLKKSPATPAERLSSIPPSIPALQRASRIGEKAAGFGFDWNSPAQVFEKVEEEFQELATAKDDSHAQEEFGDLMFALAQYARKRGWDPETLTRAANQKFLRRFQSMEVLMSQEGASWKQQNTESLERYWAMAKKQEK